MNAEVRFVCHVREVFPVTTRRNDVSGHEWLDHGHTTAWLVIGPTGPCSRHRTEAAAQNELVEWQGYFDRQTQERP